MQIVSGTNTLNVQMTAIIVTGTLSGKVTDAGTGAALSGVSVTISGSALVATTDASGNYSITNIPVGTYTITFTKGGYSTVSH